MGGCVGGGGGGLLLNVSLVQAIALGFHSLMFFFSANENLIIQHCHKC